MSNPRNFLLLSVMVALALIAIGCNKEAAPYVTPTTAGGAQAAPTMVVEEGMPNPTDLAATAEANSAMATQAALGEAGATPVSQAPTQPPVTPTPSPIPVVPSATPAPATPTSSAPAPTAQTSGGGQVVHVVQRGENLFRIALRYNTTVQAIANANGIANPALIYVGQKLLISSSGAQPPAPSSGGSTYTVQPGDNLFRIALRYNLSYLYLARYNGIANPSSIYVGQVLRIPSH